MDLTDFEKKSSSIVYQGIKMIFWRYSGCCEKKFVLHSVEIGSENHLVCYIYIYIFLLPSKYSNKNVTEAFSVKHMLLAGICLSVFSQASFFPLTFMCLYLNCTLYHTLQFRIIFKHKQDGS